MSNEADCRIAPATPGLLITDSNTLYRTGGNSNKQEQTGTNNNKQEQTGTDKDKEGIDKDREEKSKTVL